MTFEVVPVDLRDARRFVALHHRHNEPPRGHRWSIGLMETPSIEKGWDRDTSADPEKWTPENPAWGQCAVSALVTQDREGGDLLRTTVGGVSHYLNRLPDGTVRDLTFVQFGPAAEYDGLPEQRNREYVLSYPATAARYALLREHLSPGLVGVVIASRPVARGLEDGRTIELIRLTTDGSRNACSRLYGAACRAAFAMGYRRVITYTLASEGGVSLLAAGFRVDAQVEGRAWVHTAGPRSLDMPRLFDAPKMPTGPKVRWVREAVA